MSRFVLAVDHGTTSTRAIVFDAQGKRVATGQLAHAQHTPAPGWVEHDASEIWLNTREVIGQSLGQAGLTRHDIAAVGVTNQRETTVVWDRRDGKPVAPAIVWQDVRTDDVVASVVDRVGEAELRRRTGLPPSTYFSVSKLLWILDRVPGVRRAADAGHLLFGTMDSWLLWNLTGGPDGGIHMTEPTNASRTGLMDLRAHRWDDELLGVLDIPASMMPAIRPSMGEFGRAGEHSLLRGAPVTGVVGDQQASLFAHGITRPGEAKCTYGTGGFVMVHTGDAPVDSQVGLIPTVACESVEGARAYALEGSIAVAGSILQWLRDGLGILDDVAQSERIAASVPESGGVYLVPAFSGLYAPRWRPDARGTIVGLTAYADQRHLVRAALDAIALQVADVVEAAELESGLKIASLRGDGGAAVNDLLLQIQSDVLGVPVERPQMLEMTALGAALAAGIGAELWVDRDIAAQQALEPTRWQPSRDAQWRTEVRGQWNRAVERSLGWVA